MFSAHTYKLLRRGNIKNEFNTALVFLAFLSHFSLSVFVLFYLPHLILYKLLGTPFPTQI